MRYLALLVGLAYFTACTPESEPRPDPVGQQAPAEPYAERIAAATSRLSADSAGQLVLRAIEAHGGLESWYGNGPLYYHFNYRPLDDGTPRDTYITNDYVGSRAVHTVAGDTSLQFGFDGENAWSTTGGKVAGMSPRFWALTPYYFVGLPFVLADAGINFEALPATEMDGTTYDLVKVTYEDGTGDASDDYYVLYLHPETGQMDALRYIVSYPGYFPDGGHSPEKLMKITGKTKVDGITLPTGYATYWWEGGEQGEHITDITVSDYAYRPEVGDDYFQQPAGAEVYNDLPE